MSFEDSRSLCGEGTEQFQASYHKIHWYLLLVFFVSGVLGNLINMAVFTHRKMRAPIDAIFTALAISHLLFLIAIIPEFSSNESNNSYSFLLYKLISFNVEVVGMLIATWLTLTVVVWGLIEVAFEQQTHLYTMRRAIATSMAPFLICPFLCIPNFLIYKISSEYSIADEIGGGTIYAASSSDGIIAYRLDISEIGTVNHYFLLNTNAWILSVIFVIVPCIALAVLTACLIYASRKRKYRNVPTALLTLGRYESNEEDEIASIIKSNRTTETPTNLLIVLSVVFIVLSLPLGIFNTLSLSLDYRFQTCLINLHKFFLMISFIYPSITCFLYCNMREGFCDTMVYIVKPKCLKRWWPNDKTTREDMDVNGKTVTQSSTPHSYESTTDNTGQTE